MTYMDPRPEGLNTEKAPESIVETLGGWRPIETAPKDGTEIIVFHDEAGVCAAFCPAEGFAWHCMDGQNTSVGKKSGASIPSMTSFLKAPTHWMPLPAAPGTAPTPAAQVAAPNFDASQWQIVPKVPSQEMLEAAKRTDDITNGGIYVTMLAAAPTPAAQSAVQEAVAWRITNMAGHSHIVTDPIDMSVWGGQRCHIEPLGVIAAPVNGGERPSDCSGEPECCPQNEGYGCHCVIRNSDAQRVNGGEREKCQCVYATARNTPAVRSGHEMGGYVKVECDACKQRAADAQQLDDTDAAMRGRRLERERAADAQQVGVHGRTPNPDIKVPEGYCLDPNGVMCCPEGKYEDFHFGYDIGFAEAWEIANNAVKARDAALTSPPEGAKIMDTLNGLATWLHRQANNHAASICANDPVVKAEIATLCAWANAVDALASPAKSSNHSPEAHGLPAYPTGVVVGPCVCGSWPGGECLKCANIRGEVTYQLHTRNRWLDMPTMRAIVDSAFDAAIAKNALTSPAKVGGEYGDAYQGAREDLAIWKKRALEAEELNRKFMAEVSGPTHMGEPAKVGGDEREIFESRMGRGKTYTEREFMMWVDGLRIGRAALSADGGEDKRDAERYRVVRWMESSDFDNLLIHLPEQIDAYVDAKRAAIAAAIAANQAKGDA